MKNIFGVYKFLLNYITFSNYYNLKKKKINLHATKFCYYLLLLTFLFF